MAVWNPSNPPSGPASPLVSVDHRNNWAALQSTLGGVNLLRDSTFLCWPAGDSSDPAHWAKSGTGCAIARAGEGLGDTRRKLDSYTAKVTAGGAATGLLEQNLLTTTSYDDGFDNLDFGFGCWLYTTSATSVKVGIYDGAGTTYSYDDDGAPTFATASTWTWLSGVRTINGAATRVTFRVSIAAAVAAWIAAPCVLLGSVPPSGWQPGRVAQAYPGPGVDTGAITAARTFLNGMRWAAPMPCVVQRTDLLAGTAPTGAAAVYDVNKNGTTMYASKPQLAIGVTAVTTNPVPNPAAYSSRCLTRGDVLSWDCDTVGSTIAGADVTIQTEVLMFPSPFAQFLLPTEIN